MRPTEPIGDAKGGCSTRGELQVKKGEMGSLRTGAPSGHSPARDAPLTPVPIQSFAVAGGNHPEHRWNGGIAAPGASGHEYTGVGAIFRDL